MNKENASSAAANLAAAFVTFASAMEDHSGRPEHGINVEVGGVELASLMRARAANAIKEADHADDLAKLCSVKDDKYESERKADAARKLRAEAKRLTFCADHIALDKTFRLSGSEIGSLFDSRDW